MKQKGAEMSLFLQRHKIKLLFAAIGLTIYFASLFNQFVWDDDFLVVNNYLTRNVIQSWSYFAAWPYKNAKSGTADGFYRPMAMVYFAAVHTITDKPFLYHLIQIIIHITNTILVFKLLNKFMAEKPATFLATIFLIHPMNVEAVAYISATQDILCVFFGLLAILIVAREKLNIKLTLAAAGCLLLAILIRESAIVFFGLALGYGLIFKRRNFINYLTVTVWSLISYLSLRLAIANVFYFKGMISPIMQVSLLIRLLNIPKMLWFYLYTFILPIKLTTSRMWVVKTYSGSDFWLPLFGVLIIAGLLGLTGWMVRKKDKQKFKSWVFFGFWLGSSLVIYMQFIPLDFTVAERWFYNPMIGLLGLLGIVGTQINFSKRIKTGGVCVGIGIIVLLSIRTAMRSWDWRNQYTLYAHDVVLSPESFDLKTNMGVEMAMRKNYNEAEKYLKASMELAPYNYVNYNNLGLVYWRQGKPDMAEKYFLKSLTEEKYNYNAYINLARLYYSQKDMGKTEEVLKQAAEMFPNNAEIINFLAQISLKTN